MRPDPADLPILRRFPALGALPRAMLGTFPTPVERHRIGDRTILVKREDLSAAEVGGNKVRGLEWMLGGLGPGSTVITVGPTGSNHCLATAVHAGRLGARVVVVRWHQEMNDAARIVGARVQDFARVIDARWLPAAYGIASWLRVRQAARWIPAGGAATVAMLGQVNAALELADQVARGACEEPERIYVPLGTGGTAAGLALGARIAGLRSRVVAVRVVPRVLGRAGRVRRLAEAAARLIERMTGERVPRPGASDVTIEHEHYGGAYGRPLAGVRADPAGLQLDDTYSRKALAAAAASPDGALLWLTFDGRVLQNRYT